MRNTVITGDVFGIADRIKEIDPEYFIVYNNVLRRYEVHYDRRRRDTLALAVPFASLDARTVAFTQKTRRENIERLMKEMDDENKRRGERADKKILDNAKGRLEEEVGKAKYN